MILTIVVFIFVLGLFIFVHELGHFIAAKKAGIKVEEFALGFPPRLWSKKLGETVYAINAVPLGGYVKLYGEEGKHTTDPKAFYSKPLFSRFWVIVAGVLMNILLGWFLFAVGFSFGFPATVTAPENIPGAKITSEIVVSEALPNSPASQAKISRGDIIIGTGGQKFSQPDQLSNFTKKHQGQEVVFQIKAYGITHDVSVKLSRDAKAPLGVSILDSEKIQVPFWRAPILAIKEVGSLIALIAKALAGFFATLFTTGKAQEGVVTGPVGIWFIMKTATKLGLPYIAQLAALININLAIVNILPFPALDGGRLIFFAIETIRKKRVTPRIENIVHTIGFAVLIALMLLITFNDIIKR